MEISYNYTLRIPSTLKTQTAGGTANDAQSAASAMSSGLALGIDLNGPHSNLHKALAATFVNGVQLSTTPTTAGVASPALQAALASGDIVNPADWLSSSDVDLFQKTTGLTLKDGVTYDKDGNVSIDKDASDLLNSLFDMRNYGTMSNGQRKLVEGAITADDLQGYIDYYKSSDSKNLDVLNKALDTITSAA